MRGTATAKHIAFLGLLIGMSAVFLASGQTSIALFSSIAERQIEVSQVKLAAYDAVWSYFLGLHKSNSEEIGQPTERH